VFTPEDRARVRDYVLALAQADSRVTGGALTGSTAAGAEDRWSDVDVAFGLAEGADAEALLGEWTERLHAELGVVHQWDLRGGASIYRVFLLRNGLELDVGVVPSAEFGARGPSFRLVFGESTEPPPMPEPDRGFLVGLGWHHALHARAAIARGQPWKAEFYVGALKDHTLSLACLRLGEPAEYGRGLDHLPRDVTAPYEETLVRSLEPAELTRALAAATALFLAEVEPDLAARLRPLLT
jgi:hypothetical protein